MVKAGFCGYSPRKKGAPFLSFVCALLLGDLGENGHFENVTEKLYGLFLG